MWVLLTDFDLSCPKVDTDSYEAFHTFHRTQAKALVDCRLAVDQQCLMEADKTSLVYKNYVMLNMKPEYKKAIKVNN